MNIIERTQYSIDGGKTWGNTEQDARGLSASKALDELLGRDWAYHVMKAVRKHPDALITALRDMGALPEESSPDALFRLVRAGSFALYDMRYAVVPIEDYQRAAAALTEMDGAIVSGAITAADGVYAVVPMEQHDKEKSALATMRKWALNHPDDWVNHYARCWCGARNITLEDN